MIYRHLFRRNSLPEKIANVVSVFHNKTDWYMNKLSKDTKLFLIALYFWYMKWLLTNHWSVLHLLFSSRIESFPLMSAVGIFETLGIKRNDSEHANNSNNITIVRFRCRMYFGCMLIAWTNLEAICFNLWDQKVRGRILCMQLPIAKFDRNYLKWFIPYQNVQLVCLPPAYPVK